MPAEVIAVFDIGKTNKKFLLFDKGLKIVHEEEVKFSEIPDDDGFPGDDIAHLESWMENCLYSALNTGDYKIKALNFATYGATLIYLGPDGERLTPAYNYLKPMPEGILNGFYEKYGGIEEFSRKTASPALGMLNSGLQSLWLKRTKPAIFSRVKTVLHLPQYLSYLFTHQKVSEYTSIGCHTAMWDYDDHSYHKWIADEGIPMTDPLPNNTVFKTQIGDHLIDTGIGIHDSSSSLVPFIKGSAKKFILISTGTWCIFMNPFNSEPLTTDQLRKDALCYMSIRQQQVKSSRIFLGHIHDVNVERIMGHFGASPGSYKRVKRNDGIIAALNARHKGRVFFSNGVPPGYLDDNASLNIFRSFEEAYHKFMIDLMEVAMESLQIVIPEHDETEAVYISGGFARNEIFVKLLSARLPYKEVFTSEVENATALGAAMVVSSSAFLDKSLIIDLRLKRINHEI